MRKITYLLGAGASCNALPIAKDYFCENEKKIKVQGLSTAMRNWASYLKEDKNIFRDAGNSEFPEYYSSKFAELADRSDEFNTVDTYAKFLSINSPHHLDELKKQLSMFFLIEQYANKKFDQRYLVFLTNILQEKKFPKNIKIITWNYDFQMQMAAGYFQKEDCSYPVDVTRKNEPLIRYYPEVGKNHKGHLDSDYSMVHLNSIAGHYNRNGVFYNNLIYWDLNKDVNTIVDDIFKTNVHADQFMKFAWENGAKESKAVKIATEIIKDTDILIIVGYSFPFFNREIDNELFEVLIRRDELKIYYQNPSLDGSFLKNQFRLPKSIADRIDHVKNIDQFYVPFEL